MPEKQSQPSETTENSYRLVQGNCTCGDRASELEEEDTLADQVTSDDQVTSVDQDTLVDRNPGSVPQSKFKKMLAALKAFLDSLNEEENLELPPPSEKPLKESIQEFIARCRDREKRKMMLKEFGEWSRTMMIRGTVFILLCALTIWGTIWALDFNENHLIGFFPPDEVVAYLTAEHETLEAAASQFMPSAEKKDDIPFGQFDAKCLETIKPIKIYADEYGVYLMTSKGWYNGEHGIFIAKDEAQMPPGVNWGLIKGRIFTYAIYD